MSEVTMKFPSDIKYTKDHEWIKVDGKLATVGITEYAQDQLGDIVFVELPDEGDTLAKGDTLGVVESVKAVSDVYSPVSGEVAEINSALKEHAEVINSDCYSDGWMVKIEIANLEELDELLSTDEYTNYVAEEST